MRSLTNKEIRIHISGIRQCGFYTNSYKIIHTIVIRIVWLLRWLPPSDFVIACRHATVDALVAGRFRR